MVPDGLMLLNNASVLNGHQPAAERNDPGALPDVLLIKRCLFSREVVHESKPRRAKKVAQASRGPSVPFCKRDACATFARMAWLDQLERRLGFLAISGLLRYVAALNPVVFLLYKWTPDYVSLLELDPAAIMHGQFWRLLTYIFIPQIG